MNEMENTREHIRRGGRVLYRVCAVARVVLMLMMAAMAAVIVAVLAVPEASASALLEELPEDSFLVDILRDTAGLGDLAPKVKAAIGCTAILISFVLIYLLLRMFAGMMEYLADAEKPFSVDNARRMRRGAWFLLLFIVYNPLLGIVSFALMLLFSYIMEYGGYFQERADETNRIQEEMILSFAEITENKSSQTGQHIKRVSEYSRILARELGLEPERVEFVRIASTMHDVGKLLIPTEILEKPGKLTAEEYAAIQTHTTMGGQLLENVEGDEMQLSRTIALEHHERYDGSGYPARMQGEDISLEGRIVAVADVYDALTSKRSYKDAWREEDAYEEILRGRGTQFDPRVVDAFTSAHDQIRQVRETYRDQNAEKSK